MNKFRKPHGNRRGGQFDSRSPRPGFSGNARSRFGNPQEGASQMFPAICSNCGKSCEVPFRPNGKKPVLCSDCFGRKRQDRPEENNFSGRSFLQTRPAFEPPKENREIGDLKRQIEAMNLKIDSVLRILGTTQRAEEPASEPIKKFSGKRKTTKKDI